MRYNIHRKLFTFWATLIFIFFIAATTNLRAASYNADTGELFLPSLQDGSKTWVDVTIKLNPNGTYSIQSGTKSALPFQCPSLFTQATLDLLKSQPESISPEEINAVLGCIWIDKEIGTTMFNSDLVSGSGPVVEVYRWLDANCSTLTVTFLTVELTSDLINLTEKSLDFHIDKTNGSCSISDAHAAPYDLKSKLFAIGLVRINDTITASEVFIKFHEDNTYELKSYSLHTLNSPPLICESLTDANFDAISITMTPEKINDLLECQWQKELTSSDNPARSQYRWKDHECNFIDFSDFSDFSDADLALEAKVKIFTYNNSSGCGSIAAH